MPFDVRFTMVHVQYPAEAAPQTCDFDTAPSAAK